MKLPRLLFVLPTLAVLFLPYVTAGGAESRSVDVVVYGATPGGIATAVRAAREGLTVTLVHHQSHIGGMMVNGLGVLDTMYEGYRAPIFEEIKASILARYPEFPAGKPEYRKYEPHVAEKLLEELVAREKNITVLRQWYPVKAVCLQRELQNVTFRQMNGTEEQIWNARAFVDASYEGDLAHLTGAKMTVGREGRDQYGEPHAGKIFTKMRNLENPKLYHEMGLKVGMFPLEATEALPGSTGEADGAIQAYNFRVCWTRDPANRMPVVKPIRYERDVYLELRSRWRISNFVPNFKTSWNAPLLIDGARDYPEGDWATRLAITARHRDLAIGLLWFLQNDEVVPANIRDEALRWGLPKDEFLDNGGFPWEMYVREARRLVGRSVFTERDGTAAPGLQRAPVQSDSIAITEWPLDSHACTLESVEGSDHEGKVLLAKETRPGQISYQCLLPNEFDNLLVTVCVSSSHIGWGTIRLEPVWMHIGESAGYALAIAKQAGVSPAMVTADALHRKLLENHVMVALFNEFDMKSPTIEQRAAQYFGTKGYFPGYAANLNAPLTAAVAAIWAKPEADSMKNARRVASAESSASQPITAAEFSTLTGRTWLDAPAGPLTRGAACTWLYTKK